MNPSNTAIWCLFCKRLQPLGIAILAMVIERLPVLWHLAAALLHGWVRRDDVLHSMFGKG